MDIVSARNSIVKQAINEIVRGIGVHDLNVKLGASEGAVMRLEQQLSVGSDFSCDELVLQKKILCELLKELDSFEFSTRLGYTENEVCGALKDIKKDIDKICY